MKKLLPEWIIRLITIALISTFVSMFFFYLLGYGLYRNTITTMEMYLFLIMPTILFLIITMTVNYFALKQYKLDCFEENRKPPAGWIIFLVLSLITFFSGALIDLLFFQIDPYLSQGFGQALENMLVEAGEAKDMVVPISQLPLYTQNYIGIAIGIFSGTLLSVIMVSARIKNSSATSLG
jgi:hypothetical protein